MSYRKSTIDIMRELVESMTFPVQILAVEPIDSNIQKLHVCDIFHAQPDFSVVIDSIVYRISEVDDVEKTITIIGTATVVVDSFELYKPYFFYGTPIQTGMELNKESEQNIPHVPMVYFALPFDDTDQNDLSPITRKITGDLYFLTQGDNLQWLNEQAFQQGVKPMRRLQQSLEARMKEIVGVFDIFPAGQSFEVRDFPKFGVFITNGQKKSMWSDNLSGCKMRINNLGIWVNEVCEVC